MASQIGPSIATQEEIDKAGVSENSRLVNPNLSSVVKYSLDPDYNKAEAAKNQITRLVDDDDALRKLKLLGAKDNWLSTIGAGVELNPDGTTKARNIVDYTGKAVAALENNPEYIFGHVLPSITAAKEQNNAEDLAAWSKLLEVSEKSPLFFQEGGRDAVDAVTENVAASLLSSTTLLSAGIGKAVTGPAVRTAATTTVRPLIAKYLAGELTKDELLQQAGKSLGMKSVLAGAAAGATVDAGANAAQDIGLQKSEVELGQKSEVDTNQALTAAITGFTVSGVLNTGAGALSAWLGSKGDTAKIVADQEAQMTGVTPDLADKEGFMSRAWRNLAGSRVEKINSWIDKNRFVQSDSYADSFMEELLKSADKVSDPGPAAPLTSVAAEANARLSENLPEGAALSSRGAISVTPEAKKVIQEQSLADVDLGVLPSNKDSKEEFLRQQAAQQTYLYEQRAVSEKYARLIEQGKLEEAAATAKQLDDLPAPVKFEEANLEQTIDRGSPAIPEAVNIVGDALADAPTVMNARVHKTAGVDGTNPSAVLKTQEGAFFDDPLNLNQYGYRFGAVNFDKLANVAGNIKELATEFGIGKETAGDTMSMIDMRQQGESVSTQILAGISEGRPLRQVMDDVAKDTRFTGKVSIPVNVALQNTMAALSNRYMQAITAADKALKVGDEAAADLMTDHAARYRMLLETVVPEYQQQASFVGRALAAFNPATSSGVVELPKVKSLLPDQVNVAVKNVMDTDGVAGVDAVVDIASGLVEHTKTSKPLTVSEILEKAMQKLAKLDKAEAEGTKGTATPNDLDAMRNTENLYRNLAAELALRNDQVFQEATAATQKKSPKDYAKLREAELNKLKKQYDAGQLQRYRADAKALIRERMQSVVDELKAQKEAYKNTIKSERDAAKAELKDLNIAATTQQFTKMFNRAASRAEKSFGIKIDRTDKPLADVGKMSDKQIQAFISSQGGKAAFIKKAKEYQYLVSLPETTFGEALQGNRRSVMQTISSNIVAAMLISVRTAANMSMGNAVNFSINAFNRTINAAISTVRGTADAEAITFQKIAWAANLTWGYKKQILAESLTAMKTGKSFGTDAYVDVKNMAAPSSPIEKVSRGMSAAIDSPFRHAYQLQRVSDRIGTYVKRMVQEGKLDPSQVDATVRDMTAKVTAQYRNVELGQPPKIDKNAAGEDMSPIYYDIAKDAMEYASEESFASDLPRNALGILGSLFITANSAAPLIQTYLPFVRSMTNILDISLKRVSPATVMYADFWKAIIGPEWFDKSIGKLDWYSRDFGILERYMKPVKDIPADKFKRQEAFVASVITPSVVAAAGYMYYTDGTFNPGSDVTNEQSAIRRQAGVTAPALLLEGNYYNISQLDPLVTGLTLGGLLGVALERNKEEQGSLADFGYLAMGMYTQGMYQLLKDKTSLKTMVQYITQLDREFSAAGKEPSVDQVVSLFQTTSAFMIEAAFPSVIKHINTEIDPLRRDMAGPMAVLYSTTDRSKLPPAVDTLGMYTSEARPGGIANPFQVTTQKSSKAYDLLMSVGSKAARPSDFAKINGVELTDWQRHDYMLMRGTYLRMELEKLMDIPDFDKLPKVVKDKYINKAKTASTSAAKDVMRAVYPTLQTAETMIKLDKYRKPERDFTPRTTVINRGNNESE